MRPSGQAAHSPRSHAAQSQRAGQYEAIGPGSACPRKRASCKLLRASSAPLLTRAAAGSDSPTVSALQHGACRARMCRVGMGLGAAWEAAGRLLGGCWEAAWEAAGRRCWEAAGRHRRVPLTTPADSHHRRSVRSGPWGRRRGSCRSLHAQHRAQQWWLHHADGSEHHLACRCASAGPTASITGCSP
jgi:hypothetical protein